MICTLSPFRNLHQILQNLLIPHNLKSGFSLVKTMAWTVISRFRKELSKICSAIWNSSFQSMVCEQISDFANAPLKGWVDSPARREVHHPPLGRFLGLESGPPILIGRWRHHAARHRIVVVTTASNIRRN